MKTLYLERRGCDFFNDEEIQKFSDIGNYRVGIYNNSIEGKDGNKYTIEFTRGYKKRFTNKRTNKPLKSPIIEHHHKLNIDTEYTANDGFTYRNRTIENIIYNLDLNYTKKDILTAINLISIDTYDNVIIL